MNSASRPIRKKSRIPDEYAENRIALVIGNGAYNESPLRNPVNDAKAMADVLKAVDFAVNLLTDANRKQIRAAIRKFGEHLQKSGVGLFYFAGHGVQVNGKNYLIPVSAEIHDEDEVEDEAVNVGSVLRKMDKAKNRVNILILDACRSNPYERSFRSMNRGLAMIDAPRGTLIEYSTSPGMVADDGTEANSPYTGELLNHIPLEGVEVERVFKGVRGAVIEKTGGRQVPWEASSLVGDFYFRPPVIVVPPEPEPAQPRIETPPAPVRPKSTTASPKPETNAVIRLRSTPISELSPDAVKEMLQEKGFYDRDWNKDGKGIHHKYVAKTINHDNVVIDEATGLMWQQSGSSRYMTYDKLKAYIDQLNRNKFAGFDDWRLPTLEEAMSLIEPEKKGNELYIDPVFDANQQWIWTSDQLRASVAWIVYFIVGLCLDFAISDSVRAVRVGQLS